MQLQVLHNQVLLEQQQDKVPSSQESPHSDRTSLETPFVTPVQSSPNLVSSQLRSPHVMNSAPQVISASVPVQPIAPPPILKTAPVPHLSTSLPNSMYLPQLSPLVPNLFNNPPTPQPNLASTALLNNIPQSVVPSSLINQTTVMPPPVPQLMSSVPQLSMSPVALMPSVNPFSPITAAASFIPLPQSNQFTKPLTTQPNTISMVNMSPVGPLTHVSQINRISSLQINSVPINETDMTGALIQDAKSESVSVSQMSKVLSSPPAAVYVPPLNSTHSPISTQSFSYTRPKEFIAAQTLSPIRSPSPTESPVPMLHELAAQLFPKSTRELMSPVKLFAPSPRKLPTRILECPSSPPAYVSSPPPVFSFRPQSPPEASSPTSSSSSPSPIQNPVAFLSSVLPSLPTSPPTNAMGLPKRAPPG